VQLDATVQASLAEAALAAALTSRYPGSVPFQDDPLNRHLFFGREVEADMLFHSILVEDLVVLYSRSGLGKTSLLNAGVLWRLRERRFFPMMCRVYAPVRNGPDTPGQEDPLQSLYFSIEREIGKALLPENNFLIKPPQGKQTTLWEYFKTAEFMVAEKVPITPILILDQFEELFTQYRRDRRRAFVNQLGDLVRGSIPQALLEAYATQGSSGPPAFPYSEDPPKVKVVIAMREEYLGHLAELTLELPTILKNEFRLQPLNRDNARRAITEPARIEIGDPVWQGTAPFTYAPETLDEILNFLCNPEESPEEVEEDEADPNQLQLLCHYIEEEVRKRQQREPGKGLVVDASLVGGRNQMRAIIDNFYRRVIDKITPASQRRCVEKLCENGLISPTGRRLSLAGEQIAHQFQVSPTTLRELENLRLVRSDYRLGDFYYELSHDTLIQPILEAKKRHLRASKRWRYIGYAAAVGVLVLGLWTGNQYRIHQIENDIQFNVMKGQAALKQNRFQDAETYFTKAMQEGGGNHAAVRNGRGRSFEGLERSNEAEKEYLEAIKLARTENNKNLPQYLLHLANFYLDQRDNEKAIKVYNDLLKLSPNSSEAKSKYNITNAIMAECYLGLGQAYLGNAKQDIANKNKFAVENFENVGKYRSKETLYLLKQAYISLGNVYDSNSDFAKAIEQYRNALKYDTDNVRIYLFLAQAYLNVGDNSQAREYLNWAQEGFKANQEFYEGSPMGKQINEVETILKQREPN
jgi:tetratricopeptide (TPR) repeat protein